MRLFLAIMLLAGFWGSGGVALVGFFVVFSREGMSEDAGAALFIATMLLFVGALLLAAMIKSRRRQKEISGDQLTAMGFAHWMTMDHGDGGGGDNHGD